jgi:hypothetical protein
MASSPLGGPWSPDWANREFRIICIASQGGKYADADFAAGHFIGGLVEKLRVASVSGTVPIDVAVPADLLPQIDLIAMKFGYIVHPDWDKQFYNYIPISFNLVRDVEDVLGSEGDSSEEPGTGYE